MCWASPSVWTWRSTRFNCIILSSDWVCLATTEYWDLESMPSAEPSAACMIDVDSCSSLLSSMSLAKVVWSINYLPSGFSVSDSRSVIYSEYDKSSVFYSLVSCASILAIYACYILLSAFALRPLTPGSFLLTPEAPVPMLNIESIFISETPDLRENPEILLSIEIIEVVSSYRG